MFDDAEASKREARLARERDARRAEARDRRDAEAARKKQADDDLSAREAAATLRQAQKIAVAENARLKQLRVAKLTGGIAWEKQGLRVVALSRDGDRIELAASALGELTAAGALDSSPLTFEIDLDEEPLVVPMEEESLKQQDSDDDEEEEGRLETNLRGTHCGVDSFTAEEGTVGVPPKTLLSLAKGDATVARRLEAGELLLRVRYVRLSRVQKCAATLQPRLEGFFSLAEDRDIDLKTILERELGGGRHTALSLGDWISVRTEDDETVQLVVKSLDPENAICLIQTDLEVVVLPSESVEMADRRKRLQEEAKKQRVVDRATLVEDAKARIVKQDSNDGIRLLLRFSDGSRLATQITARASLRSLMAEVDLKLCGLTDVEEDPLKWSLKSNYPRRTFPREQLKDATLADLGLDDAPSLALLVERLGDDTTAALDEEAPSSAVADVFEGLSAFSQAEAQRRETPAEDVVVEEAAVEQLSGVELTNMFERLVQLGVDRELAARSAQRFGAQLRELEQMGFGDDLKASIKYLQKYNGRMLRVVNAISDERANSPAAAAPMEIDAAPVVDPKQAFQAAFARLVAQGLSPNDAAARAIADLAPAPAEKWAEQRKSLGEMGFDAFSRHASALLDRYQGRLDRVVNALAEQAASSSPEAA